MIREASLDSQASDFCFDTPFIDVNIEKQEEFQACQDEREESLPPLNLQQFDSRELLKLIGFSHGSDRESSIFSEISDHWRDEKPHKVALGHSSSVSELGDDVGSFVGSCLDHLNQFLLDIPLDQFRLCVGILLHFNGCIDCDCSVHLVELVHFIANINPRK